MRNTVGVVSLGCAKNLVDTERMLALLLENGFRFVQSPAGAEILIVNTCGFIEPAKQESIDTILEMASYKTRGKCKTLVVTGCLSERYRKELQEAMPEIDILLGVQEYERLPGLLLGDRRVCAPTSGRVLTTPPYRAFLRIGDGCNNRCTYCAIPLIRGPLSSVPMRDLIDEAKRLADGGVKELTVIAQDTSGYGLDLYGKPVLGELLTSLAKIEALHTVRVLYTYPDTVTETLIDLLRGNDKIANYLDMPLQHINDDILTRMHRRGTKAHIQSVMEYVEQHAPEFILRTTMMVGFPGETDAQFEELLSFLQEHPFDRVGAFAFSPEEGTAAAEMAEQVPEAVKRERLDRLMRQQAKIADARNARRIGQETEMLVETVDGNAVTGRSYAEAPDVDGCIRAQKTRTVAPGDYVRVRLTGASDYDMMGELL